MYWVVNISGSPGNFEKHIHQLRSKLAVIADYEMKKARKDRMTALIKDMRVKSQALGLGVPQNQGLYNYRLCHWAILKFG